MMPPLEGSSRLLSVLRTDLVELKAFDSDHTMTWNSDRESWWATVALWLERMADYLGVVSPEPGLVRDLEFVGDAQERDGN